MRDINSVMKLSELKANACNQRQGQENTYEQAMIGLGFASHWLIISLNCWPTVGHLLADCWPFVGRLLTNCFPTVGCQVYEGAVLQFPEKLVPVLLSNHLE